jgi:hypothetical protein
MNDLKVNKVLTIQDLIEHLQTLIADGEATPDTLVDVEGCDCTGHAKGVIVQKTDVTTCDEDGFPVDVQRDLPCVLIERL